MNHTKRLLRIAEKILADVHFRTQQEFDEYLKNHPNYREDTKFFVNGVQVKAPPREKNNDAVLRKKYSWPNINKKMNMEEIKKKYPQEFEENQSLIRKHFNNPSYHRDPIDLEPMASDQYTPADILEKLSKHYDSMIRRFVAQNPQSPMEILEKLSKDTDEFVRIGVAKNPSAGTQLLKKLLQDKSPRVRLGIYDNPNATQDMIDTIEKDKEIESLFEKNKLVRL